MQFQLVGLGGSQKPCEFCKINMQKLIIQNDLGDDFEVCNACVPKGVSLGGYFEQEHPEYFQLQADTRNAFNNFWETFPQ